jgi:hypothetical protein
MEFFKDNIHLYLKNNNYKQNIPDPIIELIQKYEPTSREYSIRYKPTNLTVWNKIATRLEICYGTSKLRYKHHSDIRQDQPRSYSI